MRALRSARKWKSTPLTFLGVTSDNCWHDEDRILAQALDVFEDTRIDSLGFPKRRTEEGDNEGHFEVETIFNPAQQALDQWQKSDEAKNLAPGFYPVIRDTRI